MSCLECNIEKKMSEFSWKKKPKTRQARCKLCYRKKRNEWYRTHKSAEVKTIKAYIYKRRKEIKKWFDNYKSTTSCSKCPENRIQVLQFHHLDPSQKDINLSLASRNGWSIERIQKEIAKCSILCANCHIMEHHRLRGGCSGS